MIIANVKTSTGEKVDILINETGRVEKITKVGEMAKIINRSEIDAKKNIIYCKNETIIPGLVDIHVHLREPGFEGKETIKTGSMAAVRGGVTALVAMPNTKPVIDNPYLVKYIIDRQKEVNLCKIFPAGCITKGQKGEELAEIKLMKQAGAKAFTDDGKPVMNSNIMKLALEYTKDMEEILMCHEEDTELVQNGVMNEGETSLKLGLPGVTKAAEEVHIARDVVLAENLKTKVHIQHVSTKLGLQLIRDAKRRGVKVTCETCPHYFSLTDEIAKEYNTFAKVNPPIREEEDRKAVIEAIKDGVIDVICTDHAPHTKLDKETDFQNATNGISGIETLFSLSYTKLVKENGLSFDKLIDLISNNPAKILNIENGDIKIGALADFTLVDLDEKYVIDSKQFFSKGKNTPFNGMEVYGKVIGTIVEGKLKYYKEEIIK